MNDDTKRHLASLCTYESLADYVLEQFEAMGFGTDVHIDGADCVEAIGNLYAELKRERAEYTATFGSDEV